MTVSRTVLTRFVETLIGEEAYDEEECVWTFADGTDCATCTSGAHRVARQFGGVVMGYWSKENSRALIGHRICDGHDFALIRNRWIVDYWAYRVADLIPKPVWDLDAAEDGEIATRLYGERDAWRILS